MSSAQDTSWGSDSGLINHPRAFRTTKPKIASKAKKRGKPWERGLSNDRRERMKKPNEPNKKMIHSNMCAIISSYRTLSFSRRCARPKYFSCTSSPNSSICILSKDCPRLACCSIGITLSARGESKNSSLYIC